MVEILAATLTGANYSYEATSFFDAAGDPPGVGHFIIAVHTESTVGPSFADRLEQLAAEINLQDGARLPGTRRFAAREDCRDNGVSIPEHLLKEIEAAAVTTGSAA